MIHLLFFGEICDFNTLSDIRPCLGQFSLIIIPVFKTCARRHEIHGDHHGTYENRHKSKIKGCVKLSLGKVRNALKTVPFRLQRVGVTAIGCC